jgi:hypothetical protein
MIDVELGARQHHLVGGAEVESSDHRSSLGI